MRVECPPPTTAPPGDRRTLKYIIYFAPGKAVLESVVRSLSTRETESTSSAIMLSLSASHCSHEACSCCHQFPANEPNDNRNIMPRASNKMPMRYLHDTCMC